MNTKHLTIHIWLTIVPTLLFVSGGVLAAEATLNVREPVPANEEVAAALPGLVEPLATLWDQTGGGGPIGTDDTSSSYTGLSSSSSRRIADDFVISETVNMAWLITSVEVLGVASGSIGSSMNIQFYRDIITSTVTETIHIPGAVIYNAIVTVPLITGTLVINLPDTLALFSGTYWVSAQANLGSSTSHTWRWTERSNVNPYTDPYSGVTTQASTLKGLGGSNDCTAVWKPRKEYCWIGINPDMQFRLKGFKITFTNFLRLPVVVK